MIIIGAARVMANTTLATINNTRFGNVTTLFFNGSNQTSSPPAWAPAIQTLIGVYPDFLGPIAYLLLFLIPFGMIWMAHGNMKLLGILGIITSIFVAAYLPSNFFAAAVICMVVSVAGFIWGMTRP
jgi:hypothetical protein